MSYKAIYLKPGGGYDNVVIGSCEAAAPKGGEITVRLRASSLNYHDFAVVSGLSGPRACSGFPWQMVLERWLP